MNKNRAKALITLLFIIILLSPPSFVMGTYGKTENEKNYGLEMKPREGDFSILYPRCSDPAIVEKGAEFDIIIEKCNFSQVMAKIETAYEKVVDEIYLDVMGYEKGDEVVVHVEVPKNTPQELYNLTVIIKNGDYYSKTQPRAVSVVDKIDGNFTFVHLTDFHIGDIRGFKENVRETIGWKAAKKCVEEINLLHPDFAVITGDVVFGQLYPFEYSVEYPEFYRILQTFDVPTFLCPGNHDGYVQTFQDGFTLWQKYFGPLYYSFDYGKSHFVMANSYDWPWISRFGISYLVFNWGGYIGEEQMSWIENDLKESDAEMKIIALHHNPLWDTRNDSLLHNGYVGREKLLSLIGEYGVDAILDGHVHYDDVTINNGTIYITTTTAASSLGSNDAYWGYRLIEVKNYTIYSYNYKEPKFSIPSYRLNISHESDFRVNVENNLDMDMDVHLKFVIPSGRDYTINGGILEMERKGDENMEIYVLSHIEKHTEKEIYVELL